MIVLEGSERIVGEEVRGEGWRVCMDEHVILRAGYKCVACGDRSFDSVGFVHR
jgi:hypothetical protein